MTTKRQQWLADAERLRDEGKPYFACDECKGPTVVDEDGCCVYCGEDTVVVNATGDACDVCHGTRYNSDYTRPCGGCQ